MTLKSQMVLEGKTYEADLSKPIDLSQTLSSLQKLGAWYIDPPRIYPVEMEGFVGSIAWGGTTNFKMIEFNPHAHTTHTECLGHITEEFYSVNECIEVGFKLAALISVESEAKGEDQVISVSSLKKRMQDLPQNIEALILRSLPNTPEKQRKNYSHSNPPYLEESAMRYLVESGIQHLLIDLPSVDKEKDGGGLKAHKVFWGLDTDSKEIRKQASITELIYVDNAVEDGMYLLDLVFMAMENDAAPSRPLLYKLKQSLSN